MNPDPIIDEIRQVRHCISEEYDHDPEKLVKHFQELEKTKYADRVVKRWKPQPAPKCEKID